MLLPIRIHINKKIIIGNNNILKGAAAMNLINQSKNPNAFPEVTQEEKTLGMLIWILNIFTNIVGPLILWAVKKDDSECINQQGKNYINFAISYAIYGVGSLILMIVLIGYLTIFLVGIAALVYSILGIIATNKGEDFVAPFTIEIFK